nr:hypothetical protein 4 [bacterium]
MKESDAVRWNDVNIHLIEKLWIEGFEEYVLTRGRLENFVEFIQYKTASFEIGREVYIESRNIGWTDGEAEYVLTFFENGNKVIREINERVHFHPLSLII